MENEQLKQVVQDISVCTKCVLHETRTNTVPGTGSTSPKIMFIGEAPGANEDLQGKPFVGRAGNLLTQLIESINLTREDVFIGNILKCRPPGNRNPKPEEIKTCTPYLERQINALKPKVIAPLGTFSTNFILNHY
ncbi:MAG: uracil-DNA glycosylase, partial [Candidatus Diapherotrites archaeon]|nr:uracil-DNA glycosylase [Candidatus Diapherotrites archaeon]